MSTILHRYPPFNGGFDLSILDHAESRVRTLPFSARHIAKRCGLPPSTALTVAELIGYAVGGDR